MQIDTLDTIDTPSLLLDGARMDRNIERMRRHVEALGVALRPHLKTVKCVDIARRMVGVDDGITVSTLREAEYFADNGYTDIFYAVAIAPQKLEQLIEASRRITGHHETYAQQMPRGVIVGVRSKRSLQRLTRRRVLHEPAEGNA